MEREREHETIDHHEETVVNILHAMANITRLKMLHHMLDEEITVGDLAKAVGLSQSAASQHLSKLHIAAIVVRRRKSQTIYYRVVSDAVRDILNIFKNNNLKTPINPRPQE